MDPKLRPLARRTTIALALTLPFAAAAGNWPQWRGPSFNGYTTETNLPTTWSKTQNVVWESKLPGPGSSTPIVWDDRVFVTAIEAESKKMWALCVDRKDGHELWRLEAGEGFFGQTGNNGASPSPICDGQRVYFMFGTGDLFACDLDGQVLWKRNLQEDHGQFQILWKWGGSPLLWDGKLYVAVLHQHTAAPQEPGKPKPASYLLCVDPATGKDVWKHERETDAPGESMEAYITPYPYQGPNGTLLIIPGGDYVTAHDPATGREVWRSLSYNPRGITFYRVVPSSVGVDGLVTGYVPRGDELFALKADGTGQLPEEAFAWILNRNAPDVCTPLVMDGKLFVLDGVRKVLSCVAPKTGAVLWDGKLDAKDRFRASPTGADGKIYCMSMDGTVFVLSAGDKFEVLSRIEMGGTGDQSTIAAAQGQLFIRTSESLYCVGKR
jgi:outer membrane protein assembly factor BamB